MLEYFLILILFGLTGWLFVRQFRMLQAIAVLRDNIKDELKRINFITTKGFTHTAVSTYDKLAHSAIAQLLPSQ